MKDVQAYITSCIARHHIQHETRDNNDGLSAGLTTGKLRRYKTAVKNGVGVTAQQKLITCVEVNTMAGQRRQAGGDKTTGKTREG